MIDEKKIEKMATEYVCALSNTEREKYFMRNAFLKGIERYLQNLWHDASEEPKPTKLILCQRKTAIFHYMLDKNREEFQWDRMVHNFDIVKWCYIDDLLPKEGGEK